MLETLKKFHIDIVAQIVQTEILPVLILLQAVVMAVQCISWTLGLWGGNVICKWREYLVTNIVHVRLSIFKYCLICLHYCILPNITQYSCLISYTYLAQCVASCCLKGRVTCHTCAASWLPVLIILSRTYSGYYTRKTAGQALLLGDEAKLCCSCHIQPKQILYTHTRIHHPCYAQYA